MLTVSHPLVCMCVNLISIYAAQGFDALVLRPLPLRKGRAMNPLTGDVGVGLVIPIKDVWIGQRHKLLYRRYNVNESQNITKCLPREDWQTFETAICLLTLIMEEIEDGSPNLEDRGGQGRGWKIFHYIRERYHVPSYIANDVLLGFLRWYRLIRR